MKKLLLLLLILNKSFCEETYKKSFLGNLSISAMRFYQKEISNFLGRSCRFKPTCSNYALQATEKYGFTVGLLMASDRLLRCHSWGDYGFDPIDKHYILASYKDYNINNDNYDNFFDFDKTVEVLENNKFFADELFEDGFFKEAILEYKRVLFEEKNLLENDRYRIKFRIGLCYIKLLEYQKALELFKDIYKNFQDKNYRCETLFMISYCYYFLKLNNFVKITCQELLQEAKGNEIFLKTLFLLLFVSVDEGDWDKSISILNEIKKMDPSLIVEVGSAIDEISKFKELPKKSELLGGMLSIIPGLGKIYGGKPYDGIFTFFFINTIGVLSYESIKNETYVFGGILSLICFNFYIGNIYGGIDSVRQYNINKLQMFKEYIKSKFKKEFLLY
ncbi:MAG: membrane protein insertion efficiency factor YidD [Endomicrobia bacterium]|nr:membrane protein insertion efficiency factor YidD [Endomicrobiia bacterium]